MKLTITEARKIEWRLHPTKGWRAKGVRRPKANRRLKRPKLLALTYFEKFGKENPTKTRVKRLKQSKKEVSSLGKAKDYLKKLEENPRFVKDEEPGLGYIIVGAKKST